MKQYTLLLALTLAAAASAKAPETIADSVMQTLYQRLATPYKYGMVVAPETSRAQIDCPTVFRSGDRWYMTYVRYNGRGGKDGRGYETWLAASPDLLHWTTLGRALAYAPAGWDMNQRGGFPSLVDWTWAGSYQLGTYRGRHYMTYIGGHGTGYEAISEPLSIGLASLDATADLSRASLWQTQDAPILSYNDKRAQWWERMTQYKSTVYEDRRRTLGARFVMYYNAGGKDATHPKGERIGIALSDDMSHWRRYKGNPVFAHDTDGTITGDAQIIEMPSADGRPLYVMVYFSAFNPTRTYKAYNTFAASRDLIHWQDWTGPDLVIPSKPYDRMFAHKSCVVSYKGTVYHFYCAVNQANQRGIALATSRRMGASEVNFVEPEADGPRTRLSLDGAWTVDSLHTDRLWRGPQPPFKVDAPFNLDDYYGSTLHDHGNLHGTAVVSRRFTTPAEFRPGRRAFLRFEGVGTYADITLNGHPLGHYDIGRTVCTIDATAALAPAGETNLLSLRLSHPAGQTDMPWVCGGCSTEWGFSEGSQPFGIYRPAALELTDDIRIEPFGTHIWQDGQHLYVETELRNYSATEQRIALVSKLTDADGRQTHRMTDSLTLAPGATLTCRQTTAVGHPHLWSTDDPYLYTLTSIVKRSGRTADQELTPFGFRSFSWPKSRADGDGRFFCNSKPTFINGVCEYEHLLGQSHAFAPEQVDARCKQVAQAGFNAFRDAHQPHNLRYQQHWDKEGILWWPQFSAHIWYDSPQFRESFLRHLVQWVKERRNSPSLMLWGLQNESTLPADFARQCCDTIRSLDPTCGRDRLITTCNGGEGSDWNVVQNWSGTYGGNPALYGHELARADQLLNGEYGCWRTLGYHAADGDAPQSEEHFTRLLALKDSLATAARDSVCGHFLWLLTSHDNPGRRQPDEALRRVDKVGPYNYKGLLSPWEQPADAYYMYKARHRSADCEPFVYLTPGGRPEPYYSNCDSVAVSVGGSLTTATGYCKGQPVCADTLASAAYSGYSEATMRPADGWHYLCRVNCGGDAYTDSFGSTWAQDGTRWSHSWGEDFGMPSPYQCSQAVAARLPVSPLLKTFRYGRQRLAYRMAAPRGRCRLELYFAEPWIGAGSTRDADYSGLRLFDIAVNDSTVARSLDLWAQAGYGQPYRRVVEFDNQRDTITISFPRVAAGQAVISAIALAAAKPAASDCPQASDPARPRLWQEMDTDTLVHTPDSLLPPRETPASVEARGQLIKGTMVWHYTTGVAKVQALRWKFANTQKPRQLRVVLADERGQVVDRRTVSFVQTPPKPNKRRTVSMATASQLNAGRYTLILSGEGIADMTFDPLVIE